MASPTTFTILLGFAAVFWCLEPLETSMEIQAPRSGLVRLAAAALLPAMVTTFGLTSLLLFGHARVLGRANAGAVGGGAAAAAAGRHFLDCLAKATLAATAAALLAGAVLRLVADG